MQPVGMDYKVTPCMTQHITACTLKWYDQLELFVLIVGTCSFISFMNQIVSGASITSIG